MRNLLFLFWSAIVFCSCNQQKTNKQEAANPDSSSQYGVLCAPEVMDKSWYTSGKTAPLFSQLEGIHFPVSTKSAQVQQYFNQGLMLSYGFNHAEAARSFYEAARQDSTCAMCWWDAVKVYEEDLKIYRENGWALRGMMNAFEKLGDKKNYDKTKRRFEQAWKYADINIASSRIL